MRSGLRTLSCALATVLALGACSSTEPDRTLPPSSAPAPGRAQFSELVTLARENGTGMPSDWHVNEARTAVVYALGSGPRYAVWVVDNTGSPRLLAETGRVEGIDLAPDDRLAITEKNESTGEYRILSTHIDGSQLREVATAPRPMAVAGFSSNELIYTVTARDAIGFSAWNTTSGETRTIGSITQEDPNVWSASVVGGHIVSTGTWDDRERLLALSIGDGTLIEVPHHDPLQLPRLVGAAPNGDGIFTEPRKGGGYVYRVDLATSTKMIDITDAAVVELVFMEGNAVRFGTTAGEHRLLDLATGEETIAPSLRAEPPAPVPGLEEGRVRLIDTLDNGNWIVTGWLVDGAQYRALWDFNQQFGGATSDEEVSVKGLFEYDPETQELWQLSGPPTFSSTTTASGSGTGPDGVLQVEVLEGFVVFTTGFSGAAYDIAYNLYASPIPSALDR